MNDQFNDAFHTRSMALEMALRTPGLTCTQDVLDTAKSYLDFLTITPPNQETPA